MTSTQALTIIAYFCIGLATITGIGFILSIILIVTAVREIKKRQRPRLPVR